MGRDGKDTWFPLGGSTNPPRYLSKPLLSWEPAFSYREVSIAPESQIQQCLPCRGVCPSAPSGRTESPFLSRTSRGKLMFVMLLSHAGHCVLIHSPRHGQGAQALYPDASVGSTDALWAGIASYLQCREHSRCSVTI